MEDYDYRDCQSLFGYAAKVHERSGGICQLCGMGGAELSFDLWRQLTVEHLIGESQGGYREQIKAALAGNIPELGPAERAELASQIDAANTVTACSFCNSTTSRSQAPVSMTAIIETAPDGTPGQICAHAATLLGDVLADKKQVVTWKLAAIRKAFDSTRGAGPGRCPARGIRHTAWADREVRCRADRRTNHRRRHRQPSCVRDTLGIRAPAAGPDRRGLFDLIAL